MHCNIGVICAVVEIPSLISDYEGIQNSVRVEVEHIIQPRKLRHAIDNPLV